MFNNKIMKNSLGKKQKQASKSFLIEKKIEEPNYIRCYQKNRLRIEKENSEIKKLLIQLSHNSIKRKNVPNPIVVSSSSPVVYKLSSTKFKSEVLPFSSQSRNVKKTAKQCKKPMEPEFQPNINQIRGIKMTQKVNKISRVVKNPFERIKSAASLTCGNFWWKTMAKRAKLKKVGYTSELHIRNPRAESDILNSHIEFVYAFPLKQVICKKEKIQKRRGIDKRMKKTVSQIQTNPIYPNDLNDVKQSYGFGKSDSQNNPHLIVEDPKQQSQKVKIIIPSADISINNY